MPDTPTLTAAQRDALAVALAIDCRWPDDLFELVAGWLVEARAEGWREGFKQGGPMHDEHHGEPDKHKPNPYRSTS